MIIITNIIIYFVQIRHTDDFPSTGTRLVIIIVFISGQAHKSKMNNMSKVSPEIGCSRTGTHYYRIKNIHIIVLHIKH